MCLFQAENDAGLQSGNPAEVALALRGLVDHLDAGDTCPAALPDLSRLGPSGDHPPVQALLDLVRVWTSWPAPALAPADPRRRPVELVALHTSPRVVCEVAMGLRITRDLAVINDAVDRKMGPAPAPQGLVALDDLLLRSERDHGRLSTGRSSTGHRRRRKAPGGEPRTDAIVGALRRGG